MVNVGQLSTAWVAPGGTSYYRVSASRRADIYISLEVAGGDAELRFYGPDPTFNNVRSRSEGQELFAEEYFVESGTDLFFAVFNPSALEGREFRISVVEDAFLSPVGIAMRGEIFRSARELKPGRNHEESMNLNGLNYYMTRVSKGRNLRITASDIPDSVELVWLEAREGYYSGVYTFRDRAMSSIEITDVAPGTECYFYMVADPLNASLGSVFMLTIEEYMR
jgi:hypothetical protein